VLSHAAGANVMPTKMRREEQELASQTPSAAECLQDSNADPSDASLRQLRAMFHTVRVPEELASQTPSTAECLQYSKADPSDAPLRRVSFSEEPIEVREISQDAELQDDTGDVMIIDHFPDMVAVTTLERADAQSLSPSVQQAPLDAQLGSKQRRDRKNPYIRPYGQLLREARAVARGHLKQKTCC